MGMSDVGYGGLQHGTFEAKRSPCFPAAIRAHFAAPPNEMNA